MEGLRFSARRATVWVDEHGIEVYTPPRAGTRLAWSAIDDIQVSVLRPHYRPGRAVVLSLVGGSTLILPVPLDRPRRAAEFDAASGAILEAYRKHHVAPDGPSDEIPAEYLVGPGRPIERYPGQPTRRGWWIPSMLRPGLFAIAAAFLVGVIGLCGALHSLARDRPAYDSFRSPAACSAWDAASGLVPGGYCRVTDGQVDSASTDAKGDVDSLIVGPIPATDPLLDPLDPGGDWTDTPTQFAFFAGGVSELVFEEGEPIESYVAQKSGDVASLTMDGVTYQTTESPQIQHVADMAALSASLAWMLLCGFWFSFRMRLRRYAPARVYVLLTCCAAFLTSAVVAASASGGGNAVTTTGTIFVLIGAIAPAAGALLLAGLTLALRQRARRLLYRQHRALP